MNKLAINIKQSKLNVDIKSNNKLNVNIKDNKQVINIKNNKLNAYLKQNKYTIKQFNLHTIREIETAIEPAFLPFPDDVDYAEQYFYFGWVDVDGSPLIRRYLRGGVVYQVATVTDGYGVAWMERTTLTYS